MKKIFLFFTSGLLLLSCSKPEGNLQIVDPTTEILFQIEQTNSDNNFISKAKNITFKEKRSSWYASTLPEKLSMIIKEVLFDITLENGETVEFGLWFSKSDVDKNLLILDGNKTPGKNWDYISSETEFDDFYKNSSIRVLVNNTVIFTQSNDDNLKIINIEKAIVNGKEKSFLTINFKGKATGWYDPEGKHSAFYNITNGKFKGVIE